MDGLIVCDINYHWLVEISCHFRDWKVLLFANLTRKQCCSKYPDLRNYFSDIYIVTGQEARLAIKEVAASTLNIFRYQM